MCDESGSTVSELVVGSPEREIFVQPIAKVEKKNVPLLEDDEEEIFKMRSKLYRYTIDEEDGGLWKERGVGDVRILKHKSQNSYRLVMRRDKTLKLCANHQLLPNMVLKSHMGNEKAFVWSTPSDCSEDLLGKAETLCIRFGKIEGASDFKTAFEKCVDSLSQSTTDKNAAVSEKLVTALSSLEVSDKKDDLDSRTLSESKKDATADPDEAGKPKSTSCDGSVPSNGGTNLNGDDSEKC